MHICITEYKHVYVLRHIFTPLRTNNGALFVDWLAIKQFAFALSLTPLSILVKVILAFHRHSPCIKNTVHVTFGQLSTFKLSNAYAFSS